MPPVRHKRTGTPGEAPKINSATGAEKPSLRFGLSMAAFAQVPLD